MLNTAGEAIVFRDTVEGSETSEYISIHNPFNYSLTVAVVDSEQQPACSKEHTFTVQPLCSSTSTTVVTLAPFSNGKVGSVYFRPSVNNGCNGVQSGAFYLRNNATILEKVEVRGNSTAVTTSGQCLTAVDRQLCAGDKTHYVNTAVQYCRCMQYSKQYISYKWLYFVVAATVTILVLYLSMLQLLVPPAQNALHTCNMYVADTEDQRCVCLYYF
jgi:hypothetical protein